MKKIDWNKFQSDEEIIIFLKSLPRYNNNAIKSAICRAKFFVSLLYCKFFNLIKPLFVVLVTNNSCNINCSYCYGSYGDRKSEDYSTKELLKIIDELKELGTKLLTVHGGESLLRKDFGEILNYAKLQGFYIGLNTNGYLVPHKINEIKLIDATCLSLDGREENNDRNRGIGCYKKVIEAIDVLQQHKMPVVISATLTKNTMHDIEYLVNLGKEKDFRVQYHILYNSDKMKGLCADIAMSDEDIRTSAKKILELKREGNPVYWSERVFEIAANWPVPYDEKYFFTEDDMEISKKNELIPCYHGKLKYQIDADGRVVTCWAHDDQDAPNVKELGVAKAIQVCNERDKCRCCAFFANNEHNALMDLSFKTFLNILRIQVADAFKIKGKN